MASKHWSRDMYTLWWRDAGTSRMRCTFAPDKEVLFRKALRCTTDGSELALYNPDGARIPIPAAGAIPGQTPKKKRKKRAKKTTEPQPAAA